MSSSKRPDSSTPSADSGRTRQLALLALCIIGLIVASFAVPAVPSAQETGTEMDEPRSLWSILANLLNGEPEPTDEDTIRHADDNDDGESEFGEGITFDGDGPPKEGCAVALVGPMTPGSEIDVYVWLDGVPVDGRTVWFNGQDIGETNNHGYVTGEIPYRKKLEVDVSGDTSCAFVHAFRDDVKGSMETNTALSTLPISNTLESDLWTSNRREGNASKTVTVDGKPTVRTRGEPIPGRTVTVIATIGGVPMREASVAVDGEQTGHTDDRGRYTLRIPDDDTDALRVTVARGDFERSTVVSVSHLEVNVVPATPLPVPGSEATIQVAYGSQTVSDASVTVDGQQHGTTDERGRIPFQLSSNPATTVTVRANGHVATTSLWRAYATTIISLGLVGFLFVGSHVRAYRHGSRRRLAGVAAGWVVLALLVTGIQVAGRDQGLVVLAAIAFVGLGFVIVNRGVDVDGGVWSLADAVTVLVQSILAGALELAEALEAIVLQGHDALVELRSRLAAVPQSVTVLAAEVVAWLRRILFRVRDGFTDLDKRKMGAVVTVVVVAAAVLAVGGTAERLAVLGLLVLAGVAVFVHRRRLGDREPAEYDQDQANAGAVSIDVGSIDEVRPSLREQWRAFARRIDPVGWRRRTPGEVARSAVEQGFPREPVTQFTEVFREVEYGNQPLSSNRRTRATEAFGTLESAAPRAEDGDES